MSPMLITGDLYFPEEMFAQAQRLGLTNYQEPVKVPKQRQALAGLAHWIERR